MMREQFYYFHSFALSAALMGNSDIALNKTVIHAFLEIGISILIGVIAGIIIHLIVKRKRCQRIKDHLFRNYIFSYIDQS